MSIADQYQKVSAVKSTAAPAKTASSKKSTTLALNLIRVAARMCRPT